MFRTAILGIVAVNAWSNVPYEIKVVVALGILAFISSSLIKITKPIIYTLKGTYSIIKWICAKITIPIRKITQATKLEKDIEAYQAIIQKNKKIIKSLTDKLDLAIQDKRKNEEFNEKEIKELKAYRKTLEDTNKELGNRNTELYKRNNELLTEINELKENSNLYKIEEIGEALNTPIGGNITNRARFIYEEYKKLKEGNETLKNTIRSLQNILGTRRYEENMEKLGLPAFTHKEENEKRKKLKYKVFGQEFTCEGNTLEIILDESGSMDYFKEEVKKEIIKTAYSMPEYGTLQITAPIQNIKLWITTNQQDECFQINGVNVSYLEKDLKRQLDLIQFVYCRDLFDENYTPIHNDIIIITDGDIRAFDNVIKHTKQGFKDKNTTIICLQKINEAHVKKFGLQVFTYNKQEKTPEENVDT